MNLLDGKARTPFLRGCFGLALTIYFPAGLPAAELLPFPAPEPSVLAQQSLRFQPAKPAMPLETRQALEKA